MRVDRDFYSSTAWGRLPLSHRLKQLHIHYCTGPCGQSSSVSFARSNTAKALADAKAALAALAGVEWSAEGDRCPECSAWQGDGHADHCKVGKALAAANED